MLWQKNNAKGEIMADVHIIETSRGKAKYAFWFIIIALIVIIVGCDTYKIVPAGNIAVVTRLGKVMPRYMQPGLNFKLPLLERTYIMTTRLQEYTMSIAPREGKKEGDDAITALTKEGLTVSLDLTAWYKLIPSEGSKVFNEIGEDYDQKVIRPLLRTVIRDVVVQHTAEDLYSSKRESVNTIINQQAAKLVEGKGVIIERILLRNVNLPTKLVNAINEKQEAEQHAKKMQFVLDKERLEAERKVVEAKGIKEYNLIISQGLTPNYIQWYKIEMLKSLLNSNNNTIVILPEDMKSMPLIMPTNLPQANAAEKKK